jgi:predicted nucleic acid-binding protein
VTACVDTNILDYAHVADRKKFRAERLLAQGGLISAQVLNEFTSVMHRKIGRSWEDVEEATKDIRATLLNILPLTAQTQAQALARMQRLAFCDAPIVASALEAGCDTLWTEDLQDGRLFGALVVRNPFLP